MNVWLLFNRSTHLFDTKHGKNSFALVHFVEGSIVAHQIPFSKNMGHMSYKNLKTQQFIAASQVLDKNEPVWSNHI